LLPNFFGVVLTPWFRLVVDKYTYDTALEVSEAFGGAIMNTLTELQPPGKSLDLM